MASYQTIINSKLKSCDAYSFIHFRTSIKELPYTSMFHFKNDEIILIVSTRSMNIDNMYKNLTANRIETCKAYDMEVSPNRLDQNTRKIPCINRIG